MTVREFIVLLQTMPQDAIMIQTMCSDYNDLEETDITLILPKSRLIRHYGHLMYLQEEWELPVWSYQQGGEGKDAPSNPEFLTAVHIAGN